jgi:phage regulator Rha-like protein
MQLVEKIGNDAYAESNLISRKVGAKHATIVLTLDRIIEDLGSSRITLKHPPKFIKEEREYRGQKFTAYLINRPMLSLLMARLKTKRAKEWFFEFNDAFYEMEEVIFRESYNKNNQEWIALRGETKVLRKETTDVIKEFTEYATKQGSKSAKFYYKHFTNATYKALGMIVNKKPKLRDTMRVFELYELILAEKFIQDKIKEYMELGRNYKDIYQTIKKDLEGFMTTNKLLHGK